MPLTTYKYVPLTPEADTIRLLKLLPGETHTTVRCEIEEVCLSKNRPYEALSYAWGDPAALLIIDVEGHQHAVTRSLDAALRHLRSETEIRVLWIDALCINQLDNEEKTKQVQKMKSIYQSASQVIIWLGETQDDSDIAMDLVVDIPNLEFKNPYDDDEKMQRAWKALGRLFYRPWWNRMWVLQEIAFSTSDPVVGCGQKWLPWKAFATATSTLRKLENDPVVSSIIDQFVNPTLVAFSLIRHRYSNNLNHLSLYTLLRSTTNFKATDPRDYVYALLSMSNDEDQLAVTPDYSKTKAEAYTQIAKHLLKQDINILCYHNHISQQDLPSWVPDWEAKRNQFSLWENSLYSASGNVVPSFQIYDRAPTFSILGMKVDFIHVIDDTDLFETTSIFMSRRAFESTIKRMARTFLRVTEPLALRNLSSANPDAFWRTLMADRCRSSDEDVDFISPAPDAYGTMFDVFMGNALPPADFAPMMAVSEKVDAFTEPLVSNMTSTIRHHRFFITRGGLIGIGPHHMLEGDVVAILLGADMPFVLRDIGEHHTLIGEAYVHGIMQGEAFNDMSDDQLELCIGTFRIP